MKEVLLAHLCGYWYLFEMERVLQVVPFNEASACINRDGRVWLPGVAGREAELCPLRLLFPWAVSQETPNDHYLVLGQGGRLLALPMQGAGRHCMAEVGAMRPLPPVFTGLSRRMIPALLVHGEELLMQIDLAELFEAVNKIAYLRRKKQQQLRRRQSGPLGEEGDAH